ncbi:MAG: hypothetical protein ACYDCO_04815 [Armatimonadota bacterium]
MSGFTRYIGVDYSGAGLPTSGQAGVQVYSAGVSAPERVSPVQGAHWSRLRLAGWLAEVLSAPGTIAGIDHSFSFPISYFRQRDLPSWEAFLEHFGACCPTDECTVEEVRRRIIPAGGERDLRLTERLAGTNFGVFDFRPHGVAHSTFAGLPWLAWLREWLGARAHWWPYDGWEVPAGKSVVVEAYPSLYRRRLDAPGGLTDHQRDAWLIAAWLQDRDQFDLLPRYFDPPLSQAERTQAEVEGWILGVM